MGIINPETSSMDIIWKPLVGFSGIPPSLVLGTAVVQSITVGLPFWRHNPVSLVLYLGSLGLPSQGVLQPEQHSQC